MATVFAFDFEPADEKSLPPDYSAPNTIEDAPKETYQVFVAESIEYERGWGSRPDGYLIFLTKEMFGAFERRERESRTGEAPDVYWNHNALGMKECSKQVYTNLVGAPYGLLHIHKLVELNKS